jgi:hypothetical protein
MRLIPIASLLVLVACSAAPNATPEPASGSSGAGEGGSKGAGGNAPAAGGYEGGSRLRVVTIEGEDGSVQPAGWFDTERDEQCGFRAADDGRLRCLPLAANVSGYFLDAGCSTPAVFSPNCAPSKYVALTDACSQGVSSLHLVGEQVSPTEAFTGTPASCTPVLPPAGGLYRVGESIALDSFVAGQQRGD